MSFADAGNCYAREEVERKPRQAQRDNVEERDTATTSRAHNHYFIDVRGREYIDIYEILNLYGVTRHPIGHAVKKLLLAGCRGRKDYETDLSEAIDAIRRELEIVAAHTIPKGVDVPVTTAR